MNLNLLIGGSVKFFIDMANIDEIKKAWELGVIDGVTTNPSLISKEGRDPVALLKEICSIVNGPVSAEAVSMTAGEMVREAESLSKIHENIVIKIPMIEEGLKAAKKLSGMGIKTNVTLVFSQRALLAARRATYVSPLSRLDDITTPNGIVRDFRNMKLYVQPGDSGSVRNPLRRDCEMGAHIATSLILL
jgi:transaldolase